MKCSFKFIGIEKQTCSVLQMHFHDITFTCTCIIKTNTMYNVFFVLFSFPLKQYCEFSAKSNEII